MLTRVGGIWSDPSRKSRNRPRVCVCVGGTESTMSGRNGSQGNVEWTGMRARCKPLWGVRGRGEEPVSQVSSLPPSLTPTGATCLRLPSSALGLGVACLLSQIILLLQPGAVPCLVDWSSSHLLRAILGPAVSLGSGRRYRLGNLGQVNSVWWDLWRRRSPRAKRNCGAGCQCFPGAPQAGRASL